MGGFVCAAVAISLFVFSAVNSVSLSSRTQVFWHWFSVFRDGCFGVERSGEPSYRAAYQVVVRGWLQVPLYTLVSADMGCSSPCFWLVLLGSATCLALVSLLVPGNQPVQLL